MGERVVCRNEHWVALVPFWAVWPFETMLVPVRRVADLRALTGDERDALADILRRLSVRYDNLFRCSFPYSMGFHGRPADGGSIRAGGCTPSTSRRCCARPRCASSWSATS